MGYGIRQFNLLVEIELSIELHYVGSLFPFARMTWIRFKGYDLSLALARHPQQFKYTKKRLSVICYRLSKWVIDANCA